MEQMFITPIIPLDSIGNIGSDKNPGIGRVVGTTGTTPTDVMNNIYDIYGNGFEGTLEASGAYLRVYRGGNLNYSLSPINRDVSERPFYSDNYSSSRSVLYVK